MLIFLVLEVSVHLLRLLLVMVFLDLTYTRAIDLVVVLGRVDLFYRFRFRLHLYLASLVATDKTCLE